MDICNQLLQSNLLKLKSEQEDNNNLTFSENDKYRFIVPQKKLLEAKVMKLPFTPNLSSERDFMSFPTKTFCQQFSYYQFSLFKKISMQEIFLYLDGKKEQAPNLMIFINFFNVISNWVTTEIITCVNLKKRRSILKKFINIAKKCFQLNNLCGSYQFVLGIQHTSVTKLKETWKISENALQDYQKLVAVFSSALNYKEYREVLKTLDNFIPNLGLFLRDLTIIKEGSSDTIEINSTQIAWEKYRKLAGPLIEFENLQNCTYLDDIMPDLSIINFFSYEIYTISEGEIIKRSKTLESKSIDI